MSAASTEQGKEALKMLKSTEAPQWLTPSPSLSETARLASQYLFSNLKPYASSKSPFDTLLVDGFDAEQIWQQIELLSQPLFSGIRRQVRNFEKHPEEIGDFFKSRVDLVDHVDANDDDGVDDHDGMEVDDDDVVGEEEETTSGDEDEDKHGEKENEGAEEEEEVGGGGIEDKFLKIKELEEYLEEDEAREYGLDRNINKKKMKKGAQEDEDGDEEEQDEGEDEEDDDNEEDNEVRLI